MMRYALSLVLLFFIVASPIQATVFHSENAPDGLAVNIHKPHFTHKDTNMIKETDFWYIKTDPQWNYTEVKINENTTSNNKEGFISFVKRLIIKCNKKFTGYKEIPFKYKWIYETRDYCLRENVSAMKLITLILQELPYKNNAYINLSTLSLFKRKILKISNFVN